MNTKLLEVWRGKGDVWGAVRIREEQAVGGREVKIFFVRDDRV